MFYYDLCLLPSGLHGLFTASDLEMLLHLAPSAETAGGPPCLLSLSLGLSYIHRGASNSVMLQPHIKFTQVTGGHHHVWLLGFCGGVGEGEGRVKMAWLFVQAELELIQ